MSDTYTYLGYISLMSPFNSSPEKLKYIQERRKLYDNDDLLTVTRLVNYSSSDMKLQKGMKN